MQIGINKNTNTCFTVEDVVKNIARAVQMIRGQRVTNLGFSQGQNTGVVGLKMLVYAVKVGDKTTSISKMNRKGVSTALKG